MRVMYVMPFPESKEVCGACGEVLWGGVLLEGKPHFACRNERCPFALSEEAIEPERNNLRLILRKVMTGG